MIEENNKLKQEIRDYEYEIGKSDKNLKVL